MIHKKSSAGRLWLRRKCGGLKQQKWGGGGMFFFVLFFVKLLMCLSGYETERTPEEYWCFILSRSHMSTHAHTSICTWSHHNSTTGDQPQKYLRYSKRDKDDRRTRIMVCLRGERRNNVQAEWQHAGLDWGPRGRISQIQRKILTLR